MERRFMQFLPPQAFAQPLARHRTMVSAIIANGAVEEVRALATGMLSGKFSG
jgi:hypothetical protein